MSEKPTITTLLGADRWPPAGITALVGFIGVVAGAFLSAWLAGRRDRKQRRLAFIEKQLSEFYSPMVGLRAEIRMFSELRVTLQDAAGAVWQELAENVEPGPQAAELSAARGPQFLALIDHDNTQFSDRLMPAYRKMVDLFRDKLWLAENTTRQYYPTLVEFVDVWDRYLNDTLPVEVVTRTGHTEEKLHPFYQHLEMQHARLRDILARGDFSRIQLGAFMSELADQFKINLNQNLWGLLLSFSALGIGEYFHLCTLYWFSAVASAIMLLSVIITTFAYTRRYWKNKLSA